MSVDIIRTYGKKTICGHFINDILEKGFFGENIKIAKDWDLKIFDQSTLKYDKHVNIFFMNSAFVQGDEIETCQCISNVFEPDFEYWKLSSKDRCGKKIKAYNIPVSALYDNGILKECGTCSKCLKYCIENNKYLTLSKKERKLLSV